MLVVAVVDGVEGWEKVDGRRRNGHGDRLQEITSRATYVCPHGYGDKDEWDLIGGFYLLLPYQHTNNSRPLPRKAGMPVSWTNCLDPPTLDSTLDSLRLFKPQSLLPSPVPCYHCHHHQPNVPSLLKALTGNGQAIQAQMRRLLILRLCWVSATQSQCEAIPNSGQHKTTNGDKEAKIHEG